MILGFRLGRRVMAAAGIEGEDVSFLDSRFVDSKKTVDGNGAPRYFAQLLDQLQPVAIYFYAPTTAETVTARLASILEEVATQAHVGAYRLTKSDVFGSFGVEPIRSRREMRDEMTGLAPALAAINNARRDSVAEAIASALVGEVRHELPRS